MFIHHMLDMLLVRNQAPWPFYQQHPFFIFTAVVSLVLTAAHLLIFVVERTGVLQKAIPPRKSREYQLVFFSLDGAWAVLWVLLLVVQALLPPEHRAYSLEEVAVMSVLYVLQAGVSVPLVYYLYEDCRQLLGDEARAAEEEAAAVEQDAGNAKKSRLPAVWRGAKNIVVS